MRHMIKKHSSEEKVQKAAKLPQEKLRDKAFSRLRCKGIIEFNKKQAELEKPSYQSEKSTKKNSPLTRCSHCDKVLLTSNFSRHHSQCSLSTNNPVESIPLNLLKVPSDVKVTPKFQKNILRNFRNDEIGNVCRTDKNIIFLGTEKERRMQRPWTLQNSATRYATFSILLQTFQRSRWG